MAIALVILVVVVVVVVSVLLARRVQHPEQSATHGEVETGPSTSSKLYEGSDRPAGPDADDPVGPARMDEGDGPPPAAST